MNPVIDHLNKSVWARLSPSKICSGIGVTAIRDIPKGTLIDDFKFRVAYLEESDLLEIEEPIRNLILDRTLFTDDIMFPHPNAEATLRSFMNHSEKANCDGHITLRDIKKGEEITENYRDCTQGRPFIKIQQEYMGYIK